VTVSIGQVGQWGGAGKQSASCLRSHIGQSDEFATSITLADIEQEP